MLRYGREAFFGVVAGALLGAAIFLGSSFPALLSGDSVALQLLPIGLVAAIAAGAFVGVAVVFGVVVALVIRDREFVASTRARQKAAAWGAAAGVICPSLGLWLTEGAPMLVPVPAIALIATCAGLASWGARYSIRHADARVERLSEVGQQVRGEPVQSAPRNW